MEKQDNLSVGTAIVLGVIACIPWIVIGGLFLLLIIYSPL